MAFQIDPRLFAANLRHYREKASYTVAQLAYRADLTTSTVQSLESGVEVPTDGQLRRVAGVLGLQTEQLVLPRPVEPGEYESS